jgi:hypothetical protein
VLSLAGYVLVSFFYFGLFIAAHPARSYVGNINDPEIQIWSFAWWPHALLEGKNPFITDAIWAPAGFNLAWTTAMPGLALILTPLTLLVGPVVAFNVAAVLMPALAAWTAFLLCRYLTRSTPAALVGGYLFGFSSYMLGQQQGHLHMTIVFLVPLVALVVLQRLRGELSNRAFVVRLGPLLALQLWFSTEIVFTLSVALVVCLGLAYGLVAAVRPQLRGMLGPLALGYGLAGVLSSPLLYFALSDRPDGSLNLTSVYVADLLNFVTPTKLIAAAGWGSPASFPGNTSEQGAYLGLPALVIVALFAARRWKEPAAQCLIAALGIACVAALGDALHVGGDRIVSMPWGLIDGLPVFEHVLPVRLTLYASLAVSIVVALWGASGGWARLVLPVFAVLALIPVLGPGTWRMTPDQPSFFAGAYRTCLAPDENVLVIPYNYTGSQMLWQAQSDFYFRMAGGYISVEIPRLFDGWAVVRLINDHVPNGGAADILDLAERIGFTTILVQQSDPTDWATALESIKPRASVGGMYVYSLQPGPSRSAACRGA